MKEFLTKYLNSIVTLVCVVSSVMFWISTMNGIPARVSKLETDVEAIKTQLSRNETKTDIMLEDIKFIKQLIVEKHIR